MINVGDSTDPLEKMQFIEDEYGVLARNEVRDMSDNEQAFQEWLIFVTETLIDFYRDIKD